jgi:hypothetical protein
VNASTVMRRVLRFSCGDIDVRQTDHVPGVAAQLPSQGTVFGGECPIQCDGNIHTFLSVILLLSVNPDVIRGLWLIQ